MRGDDAEARAATAVPTADELASMSLPLGYLFDQNEADRAVLDRAVDVLAERCMTELGFPYPDYPSAPYDPTLGPVRRYLLLSVDDAEVFGYHNPRAADAARHDAETAKIDATMPSTEEFSQALYGAPIVGVDGVGKGTTPGCRSRATEQIYGTPQRTMFAGDFAPILQMQIDSSDELYASEGGRATLGDWSACMAAAGYTVDEPWALRAERGPIYAADTSPPSDGERATAVADATCRAATNLEGRLFAIESTIQQRMIDEQPDLITTGRSELAAAVDRALAVIDGA